MGQYLGEFEQLVLLALLHLGEDAYGVSIRGEIEARTGRNVSIGSVYTTLDRMERKGYVRSSVGQPTPERGGRRKKYYCVEASGQAALSYTVQAFRAMAEGLEPELVD